MNHICLIPLNRRKVVKRKGMTNFFHFFFNFFHSYLALFGNPTMCRFCRHDHRITPTPELCKGCGRRFDWVRPQSVTAIQAMVAAYNSKDDPPRSFRGYGVSEIGDDWFRWNVTVRRGDESVDLPPWSIPILDSGTVGEGIPVEWVAQFQKWLER